MAVRYFPEQGLSVLLCAIHGNGCSNQRMLMFVSAGSDTFEDGPPPSSTADALPELTPQRRNCFNEQAGEPMRPTAVDPRPVSYCTKVRALNASGKDRFSPLGSLRWVSQDKFRIELRVGKFEWNPWNPRWLSTPQTVPPTTAQRCELFWPLSKRRTNGPSLNYQSIGFDALQCER